jgi:hypothetical protein
MVMDGVQPEVGMEVISLLVLDAINVPLSQALVSPPSYAPTEYKVHSENWFGPISGTAVGGGPNNTIALGLVLRGVLA